LREGETSTDHKEDIMAQTITNNDRKCISECIVKHWSENSNTPPGERVEKYEQCLTECRICS